MKLFFVSLFATLLYATEVPLLTINDTINPGSADYLIQNIRANQSAPFILIQMDTPGGLLNSTHQIIQEILNSETPIVLWVGPQGARAASAGALIALATDVAIMSSTTHIGAAHPVTPGKEEKDSVMEEKMENDTAAFAESIAKARKRNPEWAVKAVRKSVSITADSALKENVIDFISDDKNEILKKLSGYTLRVAKKSKTKIPEDTYTIKEVTPSIRQKVTQFFSDPNISYLLMTLGSICLWIELSHPGLILPAVVGCIAILISLISFQTLPIHSGALALILLGLAFMGAEFFVASGLLGAGGVISFVLGSLFLMDTTTPEFQLSLYLIIPVTLVLIGCFLGLSYLFFKTRKQKNYLGLDTLIGELGEIKEPTNTQSGKIFIKGELWNALAVDTPLKVGDIAKVEKITNMVLIVSPIGDQP